MTKTELRQYYLNKRDLMTELEVATQSQSINNRIIENIKLNDKKVHCFKSIPNSKEIDTNPLFNYCFEKNIGIATSITEYSPRQLSHSWITKMTTFTSGPFNVPTPSPILNVDLLELDYVFVPLLCSDTKGNRIGYGKGYYDSFLKQLSTKTKKIGLSYFDPISENIIPDSWDIALDSIITPKIHFHF